MRKLKAAMLAGLLFSMQILWAQSRLTGRVTSSQDGNPLPGVTVTIKNTNASTVTDADGTFSLTAPANSTLVFSYTGYQTVESAASGDLNIALVQGANTMTEVIVTGYTTRSRRANVGAASTVALDDVRQQPVASFDQLLQGQAAGLNVKAGSGQPGRSADVIIRGRTSVNGSVTPLYIVDGIEIRANDFSTINPGDFESVTVLKDAASTSIYGSRGANGVIVVTTKKGKSENIIDKTKTPCMCCMGF